MERNIDKNKYFLSLLCNTWNEDSIPTFFWRALEDSNLWPSV